MCYSKTFYCRFKVKMSYGHKRESESQCQCCSAAAASLSSLSPSFHRGNAFHFNGRQSQTASLTERSLLPTNVTTQTEFTEHTFSVLESLIYFIPVFIIFLHKAGADHGSSLSFIKLQQLWLVHSWLSHKLLHDHKNITVSGEKQEIKRTLFSPSCDLQEAISTY